MLELGRREARRILVGKKGHGAACRQEDINALLVRLAREGKRVVRLKGGDPAVFGRTSEEVEACRAAGIPVAHRARRHHRQRRRRRRSAFRSHTAATRSASSS